ncbi:hypothetical protein IV203_015651 [Nitzschia inconspicua]|uniref:Uncharacterized protein n=1 Tax=Nitzschia inconspicua TaxID=303405 RepID=A0A9K3LBC8_9STRA|nr:hypothetical protein IV203_015651 [Nitzschia inconspicua]
MQYNDPNFIRQEEEEVAVVAVHRLSLTTDNIPACMLATNDFFFHSIGPSKLSMFLQGQDLPYVSCRFVLSVYDHFVVVPLLPFTIISLLSLFFLDFDVFNLMLCHVLVQTMRANCDYFAGGEFLGSIKRSNSILTLQLPVQSSSSCFFDISFR